MEPFLRLNSLRHENYIQALYFGCNNRFNLAISHRFNLSSSYNHINVEQHLSGWMFCFFQIFHSENSEQDCCHIFSLP